MPYVTLDQLKAHLRLDPSPDTAADAELEQIRDSAEEWVSQFLNSPVPWYDNTTSPPTAVPTPATIVRAALMYAAELYELREGSVVGVSYTKTDTIRNLLYPYRVGLGI